MSDVKIVKNESKVALTSPFHPDLPARAKNLGGKWDGDKRVWTFDARDEERVRQMCREVYGTDGTPMQTVTIRMRLDGSQPQTIWQFGREIVTRPGRDERIRLGDGVVLIEGAFAASGGSRQYPAIGILKAPVVLEVRDVPLEMARMAVELEGLEGKDKYSDFSIVDDAPIAEPKPEIVIVVDIASASLAMLRQRYEGKGDDEIIAMALEALAAAEA